jgi:sulfate adenylyltransferase
VIHALLKAYPPPRKQGVTIFFTGLSGAGKSTIAKVLFSRFLEIGDRPVTLLDGDIVRRNLSNELTFSKEHRDINVRRIGFVASEITKNRGIAICAPIAPYAATRREIRKTIEAYGGFIYAQTPYDSKFFDTDPYEPMPSSVLSIWPFLKCCLTSLQQSSTAAAYS